MDEFHALGYDLAFKEQPLTPALLAKTIAEKFTPEEGCKNMICLHVCFLKYAGLEGDYEWGDNETTNRFYAKQVSLFK